MLPSRMFRNTGIPPALRSLITPHASLPPNVAVQLRFRLGVTTGSMPNALATSSNAPFSTSIPRRNDGTTTKPPSPESTVNLSASSLPESKESKTTTSQPLPEKMVPKLSLTFTCTVTDCGERSTHQFTKHSYEKGIVLVQCPKCHNRYVSSFQWLSMLAHMYSGRHLIADHLGWFKDSTGEGKLRTVEDIVKAKGEKVRRGLLYSGGDIEYSE